MATSKKPARIPAKTPAKKSSRKTVSPKASGTKSKAAAPVGPYTPVVRAGDWVIVSGQLGIENGVLVPGGVSTQTAQAIKNLKERLKEAGVTINDVVKTLCFLTDMDTFATFNAAYVEGFNGARPARSTIGVAALPFGGAVEIEAWAFKPVKVVNPATKKTRAKKTAAKKTTAKKTTAKKAAVKKTAVKKVAAKKTATRSVVRRGKN